MKLDRFNAWAPRILGALRILTGIMFACHGAQKIFGAFGGMPPGAASPITWVAGSIEFFGGLMVALGFFARPAAFICSGLMAFAYFMGHAKNGFFPKTNGGELAVMYCWIFLYLAAHGPGAWAITRAGDRMAPS